MTASRRWPGRLAVGLFALMVVLIALGLWLERLNPPIDQPLSEQVGLFVAFIGCGALGALVAARRPGNAVGWMFLAIGVIAGMAAFSTSYANYGLLTRPGSLPLAGTVLWLHQLTWPAILGAFTYVLLLFPDGKPPSRRWALVGWLIAAGVGIFAIAELVRPELAIGQTHWGLAVPNPFPLVVSDATAGMLELLALALALPAPFFALAALVSRYRRARGVERVQLKWVTYGAAVWAVGMPVVDAVPLPAAVSGFGAILFVAVPATAAIAVLRFRLYEIDRVVSRTVSYAVVVATLAGIYAAGVIGLGGLVRGLTGTTSSDLVVAASTLAAAAAFGPVRRRAQLLVDRRFNRSRYDAARTIEAFTTRLRDEVDLAALSTDLRRVAVAAVHPTTASLWFAPPRKEAR